MLAVPPLTKEIRASIDTTFSDQASTTRSYGSQRTDGARSDVGNALKMAVGLLGLEVHQAPSSRAEMWFSFQEGPADWQLRVASHVQKLLQPTGHAAPESPGPGTGSGQAPQPGAVAGEVRPDLREQAQLAEFMLQRISRAVGMLRPREVPSAEGSLLLREFTDRMVVDVCADLRQWLEQLAVLISLYHIHVLDADCTRRRLLALCEQQRREIGRLTQDRDKAQLACRATLGSKRASSMRSRADQLLGKSTSQEQDSYTHQELLALQQEWEAERLTPLLDEVHELRMQVGELKRKLGAMPRRQTETRLSDPDGAEDAAAAPALLSGLGLCLAAVADRVAATPALAVALRELATRLAAGNANEESVRNSLLLIRDSPVPSQAADQEHSTSMLGCLQAVFEELARVEMRMLSARGAGGVVHAINWCRDTVGKAVKSMSAKVNNVRKCNGWSKLGAVTNANRRLSVILASGRLVTQRTAVDRLLAVAAPGGAVAVRASGAAAAARRAAGGADVAEARPEPSPGPSPAAHAQPAVADLLGAASGAAGAAAEAPAAAATAGARAGATEFLLSGQGAAGGTSVAGGAAGGAEAPGAAASAGAGEPARSGRGAASRSGAAGGVGGAADVLGAVASAGASAGTPSRSGQGAAGSIGAAGGAAGAGEPPRSGRGAASSSGSVGLSEAARRAAEVTVASAASASASTSELPRSGRFAAGSSGAAELAAARAGAGESSRAGRAAVGSSGAAGGAASDGGAGQGAASAGAAAAGTAGRGGGDTASASPAAAASGAGAGSDRGRASAAPPVAGGAGAGGGQSEVQAGPSVASRPSKEGSPGELPEQHAVAARGGSLPRSPSDSGSPGRGGGPRPERPDDSGSESDEDETLRWTPPPEWAVDEEDRPVAQSVQTDHSGPLAAAADADGQDAAGRRALEAELERLQREVQLAARRAAEGAVEAARPSDTEELDRMRAELAQASEKTEQLRAKVAELEQMLKTTPAGRKLLAELQSGGFADLFETHSVFGRLYGDAINRMQRMKQDQRSAVVRTAASAAASSAVAAVRESFSVGPVGVGRGPGADAGWRIPSVQFCQLDNVGEGPHGDDGPRVGEPLCIEGKRGGEAAVTKLRRAGTLAQVSARLRAASLAQLSARDSDADPHVRAVSHVATEPHFWTAVAHVATEPALRSRARSPPQGRRADEGARTKGPLMRSQSSLRLTSEQVFPSAAAACDAAEGGRPRLLLQRGHPPAREAPLAPLAARQEPLSPGAERLAPLARALGSEAPARSRAQLEPRAGARAAAAPVLVAARQPSPPAPPAVGQARALVVRGALRTHGAARQSASGLRLVGSPPP